MTPERFSHAVELIYASVLEPARWGEALAAVQDAVSGCGAILSIDSAAAAPFMQALGYGPEALDSFAAHYAADSYVWSQYLRAPEGRMLHDRQVMGEDLRRRDGFANEWAARYETADCVIFPLLKRADRTAFAIFARSPACGPFEAEALADLQRLAPHLRQAVMMRTEMDRSRVPADMALEAIDRMQDGVIFVRADGSVAHANAAAQALMASADGALTVRQGKLRSRAASETAALRRLIARAASADADDPHAAGAIALQRPDHERPLTLFCAPISCASVSLSTGLALGEPAAMILLSDAGRAPRAAPEVLAALFRLTPAETRLAARLADGATLTEAAGELGVAKTTVVSQLSAIFHKTQTNRQGELIRLLHSLPRFALT
ncbi:MAG: helix-turn-helix transcriptional regulator [Caulobacteraceae bacterium]|nr:helix-turn-helix transcriptional regulator [Caulobacteraceae bacterium]